MSGVTPLSLAFARRPPALLVLERMNPDQLTTIALREDKIDRRARKPLLKALLEARQFQDLSNDLAKNVGACEVPFHQDQESSSGRKITAM